MLPLLAGAIMVTTMSNSSTGGNVVDNGSSVVNGSSYSSVSVQTYSNDDGATSTNNIHINADVVSGQHQVKCVVNSSRSICGQSV